MNETFRFICCLICTVLGMFAIISGVVGVFRFRYSLSRLHAAALIDTAGIFFMLLGLMFATCDAVANVKMFLTIVLLWLTSPVSSHMLCRLEVTINDDLRKEMEVDDIEAVEKERLGD